MSRRHLDGVAKNKPVQTDAQQRIGFADDCGDRQQTKIAVAMVERHFKTLVLQFVADLMPDTLDAFARGLSATMNIPDQHAKFIGAFFEVLGPSFAWEACSAKVANFFDRLGSLYAKQVVHLKGNGEIRADADATRLGRVYASLVDGMILHKGLFGILANGDLRGFLDSVLLLQMLN